MSSQNEFYIGWMPKSPGSYARFVRKYLFALMVFVISIGAILALSQKKFSSGTFEFGQLTEVTGIYFDHPVPLLKVVAGKDIWGDLSYVSFPLVGYGKHGAEGIVSAFEKQQGTTLDRKEVTLKGTLLYSDGKTLLQIDQNDHPFVTVGTTAATQLLPETKDLGIQTVQGEIIDPKCYFGVMKPGEGKVHRDCAIRCILGGIPPVFHVQNEKGEHNYYLIVGPNGEKMNAEVKDVVAEPIAIKARLVQYDDWIVMYVNDQETKSLANGKDMYSLSCSPASCQMN